METAVLTAITDAGLAEGVRRTLKYAVEHHGVLEIPDDYNAENRLLESYYSTKDQIHSEMLATEA